MSHSQMPPVKMHEFWILSALGLEMHNTRVGMSKNLPICFKHWKWEIIYLWSRTKVDRIHLAINLAVSLFPKWHTNTGILSKQANPKNRILFVLYCLLVLPIHLLDLFHSFSEWTTRKTSECSASAQEEAEDDLTTRNSSGWLNHRMSWRIGNTIGPSDSKRNE